MSDKKNSKNGEISSEDVDLWKSMTEGVQLLDGKTYVAPGEPSLDAEENFSEQENFEAEFFTPEAVIQQRMEKTPIVTGQGLDRRTEERLRRGQMEIEARFDMHGFIQDEAHGALKGFIMRAYQQKKRCVLVITGKGRTKAKVRGQDDGWLTPEPGVLKRRTPEWLSAEEMRPYILKFVPAQRRDGGDGALYVLLRRHREL